MEVATRLQEHVRMLAGDIGARNLVTSPDALESAGNYIEHVFKSIGYQTERQDFNVETSGELVQLSSSGISCRNVSRVARNIIAKTSDSAEIIVLGAHYDSVHDCPAANDNASGVAVLLEVARLLSGVSVQKQIRFVAFTNEEPPFFRTPEMGSYRYARLCHERRDNIVGMYCLETVGFYTDEPNSQKSPFPALNFLLPRIGNFVLFVSNWSSRSLMNKGFAAFKKGCSLPAKQITLPEQFAQMSFSDHHSFWAFDFPAVMITDTAHYRYPHYHEKTDTYEKLNYAALAEVVKGVAGLLGPRSEHAANDR